MSKQTKERNVMDGYTESQKKSHFEFRLAVGQKLR